MALNLTEAEKAALSPDMRILAEIGEAEDRGDDEAAFELRKRMNYSAETLLAAKLSMGADWVRAQGWKLQAAEAKYGKDWLEREIDPRDFG